ncbi:MAG: hypothetical protein LJE96_02445, partial [Deltaproteobacteria bacterium]|nr:hypothetical protein [Deltaproteobacteria bacterium]
MFNFPLILSLQKSGGIHSAVSHEVGNVRVVFRRWFLLGLTLILVLPVSALAEEEESTPEVQNTLDEIVVTATKTEEKRKDLANSVIVIDAMDIEESPAKTLGELLAN